MVIVLLNWSYILFITFLTGFCFYKCLNKFVNCNTSYSLSHNIVCGIVVTTIYAQFFSIFHKVNYPYGLKKLYQSYVHGKVFYILAFYC